jgi:hypothetical protein
MDYLSEYYKNQCQILSSKKLQLENQVKILKFKTFLIEKDGGMFTSASGSDRPEELVSYTPQAGIEDIWRWIFGPGTPTPGPGISPPGRPGGSPTPRLPKPDRPWTPGQKPADSTPRAPTGPDGRPRPSPGTVPPGPPHGVPPAKQINPNPRGPGKPVSTEPNPRQSMGNDRYYFLASDGSVYIWNPTTGQWDRYMGSTPWGPTRQGIVPGVRGYN